MMRAAFLAVLLLADLAGSTPATVAPRAAGGVEAGTISEDMLMRHIAVLASDEFEGRRAGTEGERKTIAYIAAQFAAVGAMPDAGDGQWYQRVPLVERKPGVANAAIRAGRQTILLSNEQIIAITRDAWLKLKSAPVLFGGFGHQLDQVDVKGRLVLLLADPPPGDIKPVVIHELRTSLARRGALGTLMVAPAGLTWDRIRELNRGGRTVLADDPTVALSAILPREAVEAMAIRLGQSLEEMTKQAGRPDYEPALLPIKFSLSATGQIRQYDGYNVVGRIRGRAGNGEANLAGSLLLAAHHDHLGMCGPPDAKDRICNGAVDNASGVSMMIEVARQLARGSRPERDIILLATAAEELGLLGARHYVETRLDARQQIVAALNMDTVAVAPRGAKVGVIGRGLTPLDPLIDRAVKASGREVDDRTVHNALVRRQDGWAFMQAGIPAVMVGGFFTDEARMKAFFEKPYHLPEDDLQRPLELGGAAEDAALMVRLARLLADPVQFPGKSPPAP